MKNTILLLLLAAGLCYAQLDLTKFQKIGFLDPYYVAQYGIYNGFHPLADLTNYTANNYYYPRINELGLNNMVTVSDAVPLANIPYNIIDNNFDILCPLAKEYARAQGNISLQLVYQVGGDLVSRIDQRYGIRIWEEQPNRCILLFLVVE